MGVRRPLIILITIGRPQTQPFAWYRIRGTSKNGVATTPRAVHFPGR